MTRDVLDRSRIRNRLLTALGTNCPPCNILLAGPWGAGKTTLLNEALGMDEITKAYHVIWFSPWELLADEDPREGFLKLLGVEVLRLNQDATEELEKLSDEARPVWKAVVKFAQGQRTDIEKAVSEIPGGRVAVILTRFTQCLLEARENAENEKASQRKEAQEQQRKTRIAVTSQTTRLRNEVGSLLRTIAQLTGKQRCLLVVEDLDRTRPEYAIKILDDLYHLLLPRRDDPEREKWPLSSVWAVNIAMLEEFLHAHYCHQPSFDPTAYLAKLFYPRINVPPLFYSDENGECRKLWELSLTNIQEPDLIPTGIEKDLSSRLNYAVLGNLRLYQAVRDRCCEYWNLRIAEGDLKDSFSTARLLRDAELFTLVQAYPGFRESIAIYEGMWPEFVNRVNKRHTEHDLNSVQNPVYRHIDDPNLLTLLLSLGVLSYDESRDRYELDPTGERSLTKDLCSLLQRGF